MTVRKQTRSKEYFSESEYGVKASPRVSNLRTNLPRGGGRDQTGKPYKVKGKWYYPKEDRKYKKTGAASWYGDAFHGRLTANGEIYDMTHLTAAHPTMPLPSYARVTNTANGASVIVRVNDRGPYSDGRIIDLSKRAAQMLDYTHAGVAKVKVEYVGRAPLDGQDEQYLMASYRPNGVQFDPSDGLASGVMIAMNGDTPNAGTQVASAVAFPGMMSGTELVTQPAPFAVSTSDTNPALPEFGPVAPERPVDGLFPPTQTAFAVMSYADERVARAADPFAALERGALKADDVVASWSKSGHEVSGDYIAAGSFASEGEAQAIVKALSSLGRAEVEQTNDGATAWFVVTVYPRAGTSADTVLEAAWANGATDALVVRR